MARVLLSVIIYNLVKLIGLFNIHEGVSSHTEKKKLPALFKVYLILQLK